MFNISKDKQAAIVSYLSVFLNLIIGILLTPFIIRVLGNSQYGLYVISSSLIGFFVLDFGLGAAASRFISKYYVINDKVNGRKAIDTIFILYLLIDLLICLSFLTVYLFIDRIYASLTLIEIEQLRKIFVISACTCILIFPFSILNGLLTSYEKYIYIKYADIISKMTLVVFISITLFLNLGLYVLVLVNSFASLINVAYKYWAIRKHTTINLTNCSCFEKSLAKEIINFSLWITVMAVSHRFIFTVVPSILGIVSNTTEVAHFSIVLTIENYFYLISTAFSGLFIPKISRIYNEENFEEKLTNLVIKVGQVLCGINMVTFLGLCFIGKDFLYLWAGNGFEAIHVGLLLAVFPSIFYNSMEVLNNAIMVKNKVKFAGLINFIGGSINIILCFAASKYYGANGACFSIMVVTSLRTFLTYILYQKVLGINIYKIIQGVYFKLIPVFGLTILFGYIGNTSIPYMGWVGFLSRGVLIVAGAMIGTIVFYHKNALTILRR